MYIVRPRNATPNTRKKVMLRFLHPLSLTSQHGRQALHGPRQASAHRRGEPACCSCGGWAQPGPWVTSKRIATPPQFSESAGGRLQGGTNFFQGVAPELGRSDTGGRRSFIIRSVPRSGRLAIVLPPRSGSPMPEYADRSGGVQAGSHPAVTHNDPACESCECATAPRDEQAIQPME